MSTAEDSAPTGAFTVELFDETLFKASIRVTLSSCLRFKEDDGSTAREGIVDVVEEAAMSGV